MDYESFYQVYLAYEKQAKDLGALVSKLQKSIAKKMSTGELKSASIDIAALLDAAERLQTTMKTIEEMVASFDGQGYMMYGDFATQMLTCCHDLGINVIGDPPVFKMFPFEVKLDAENQDVYLDRKKYSYLRPKAFVDVIKAGQERLNKASFNPLQFAGELKNVYDIALLKEHGVMGSHVLLQTLFKFLIPMSRFKKEYDAQAFAFDLARLYNSMEYVNENGSFEISFGPSKQAKKLIRILDATGTERFLGTISFTEKA